jgi:hypothetical protein
MIAANQSSPVTGVLEEDEVIIDFGVHEGRSVFEVSETDPHFYQSLEKARECGNFVIRRHKDKTFRLFCPRVMEAPAEQAPEELSEQTEEQTAD